MKSTDPNKYIHVNRQNRIHRELDTTRHTFIEHFVAQLKVSLVQFRNDMILSITKKFNRCFHFKILGLMNIELNIYKINNDRTYVPI